MQLTAIDRGQRTVEDALEAADISRAVNMNAVTKRDPTSLQRKCLAAGLTPKAGQTWRSRHPESELTDDEIVALMVKNKRGAWDGIELMRLESMIDKGHTARHCAEVLGKSKSQIWRAARKLGRGLKKPEVV